MKPSQLIVASIVSLLMASKLSAFPIAPPTLQELCRQSDLIVVASPGASIASGKDDAFSNHKVTLAVDTILKGKGDGNNLDVYYDPHLICPRPAYYAKGKTVIAFLYRNRRGSYATFALSYGTLYPSSAGLKIYKDRISEYLVIDRQKDSHKKERELIEWMVRCVEQPATRWYGTRDLLGYRWSYQNGDKYGLLDYSSKLTVDQRKRLFEAMLTSYFCSDFLYLIDSVDDPRLVPYLMAHLQATRDAPPSYSGQIMRIVATKRKRRRGLKIADVYEKVSDNESKQKKLLETFLAEMGDFDYQSTLEKLDPTLRKHRRPVTAQPINSGFKKRYPPGRGRKGAGMAP